MRSVARSPRFILHSKHPVWSLIVIWTRFISADYCTFVPGPRVEVVDISTFRVLWFKNVTVYADSNTFRLSGVI